MKTVIIFDWCGMKDFDFVVLDGDKTHLDKVYINAADGTEDLQDELEKLFESSEKLNRFPVDAVKGAEHAAVIVAGFLP